MIRHRSRMNDGPLATNSADGRVDAAGSHGVPLKNGIPAVVVLSQQGKAVCATRAGELADARSLGDKGI